MSNKLNISHKNIIFFITQTPDISTLKKRLHDALFCDTLLKRRIFYETNILCYG